MKFASNPFVFISMLQALYEASKDSFTFQSLLSLRTFETFEGFVPALMHTYVHSFRNYPYTLYFLIIAFNVCNIRMYLCTYVCMYVCMCVCLMLIIILFNTIINDINN